MSDHLRGFNELVSEKSNGINMMEYSPQEFTSSNYLFDRYSKLLPTKTKLYKTQVTNEVVMQFLREKYPTYVLFGFTEKCTRMRCPTGEMNIDIASKSDKLCNISLCGHPFIVDSIYNLLDAEFPQVSVMIHWMYSSDGNVFDIPLTPPKYEVSDAAYPFIEGGIKEFVNEYKNSSENILILLGAPGTGKSTFLKYLLNEMQETALVTYDVDILKKDYFFGEFMEGSSGVLIMEDADTFLEARSAGNMLMHKFLNIGDGLVSTQNKKIIFTTNLESSDNIDPALVRPGRCFSVINFRPLDRVEAKTFMEEHNPEFDTGTLTGTSFTLAELYNNTRCRKVVDTKKSFGFI